MSASQDQIFVGGEFVAASSSRRIPLTNPATEEVFGQVVDADEADVDAAVQAARRALPAWRDTSVDDRIAMINRIADVMASRADEMDALVTTENGAPQYWAKYVGSGAHFLYRMAAGAAAGLQRDEVKESQSGRSVFRNDPIGVVGAIVPWNSPQVLIASKIGPAIAAGCTVVLKPSPETSLDGFMLGEIMAAAGVPDGVVNIISGGRETGAALVRHRGVDMVSFTGSTVAGRSIASVCGEQLKPVSAELGGKSAAVILDDGDVAAFAKTLFSEVIPYSGQVCYATSRIIVHERLYEQVLDVVVEGFRSAPVGDPTDPATMVGPVISSAARDKVEGYIASGREQGARVVLGGSRPSHLSKGYYVEPTVFVDVTPEMRIFQEEIFGPVAMVVPFRTDDEAVALTNNSSYGLSGTLFGGDVERATAVAARMETGRVTINGGRGFSRFSSLYKDSGIGSVGDVSPRLFLAPKNIIQP